MFLILHELIGATGFIHTGAPKLFGYIAVDAKTSKLATDRTK